VHSDLHADAAQLFGDAAARAQGDVTLVREAAREHDDAR